MSTLDRTHRVACGRDAAKHDDSCRSCFDPLFGTEVAPDPNRYLYHYTRAFTLPKIRNSMSLRLKPLGKMSDPYESHPVVPQFHLRTTPPLPSCLTENENAHWLNSDWASQVNEARQDAKILSLVMDALPDLSRLEHDEPLRRELERRATHQARGFAHPRMWDQYADRQRGVCVVFERAQLQRRIALAAGDNYVWGHGAVEYASIEHGPSIGSFEIRKLIEGRIIETLVDNHRWCFLEKHADWADEHEFRFFVLDDTTEPLSVNIDVSCVVGLVVGAKFDPQKHLRNVCAFARTFGIADRVRLVTWAFGACELLPITLPVPKKRPATERARARVPT